MPKKSAKKTVKKAVSKKVVKKAVAKKTIKKTVKRAGRPKGSGKYGCATTAVRIPIHLKDAVQAFVQKKVKAEGKK